MTKEEIHDLVSRLRKHLDQMAPHQKVRQTARLLTQSVLAIEGLLEELQTAQDERELD